MQTNRKQDHLKCYVCVELAHLVMMSYVALKNIVYCYFVFIDDILVKEKSNSNYKNSVHKTY